MHKAGFPGLQQHKEAHDMLVAQVQELQRRHKQKDSAIATDISQFMLKDWLVKHILGMDELSAPYFKKAFLDAGKRMDAI